MKWFIPAWNGDWRLEPDPKHPEKRTLLKIDRPTAGERQLLAKLRTAFDDKRWLIGDGAKRMDKPGSSESVVIDAPLSEIGPLIAAIIKPGPNVLTAVRFKDGHIEVCETSAVPDDAEKIVAPESEKSPKPSEGAKELAKKPDALAAATVKRPTPCCPNCFTDMDAMAMNQPATEVLLAFLDEQEHASWAEHRYIVVHGGITGHRYLIAHRNSPIAEMNTRLCFDLDDDVVMHFHMWEVPAEEEVLTTKLILEHREPWLRNQATALGGHRYVFKNPFGDGGDGVIDSNWTYRVGDALLNPELALEHLAAAIVAALKPHEAAPKKKRVYPIEFNPHLAMEVDEDGNAMIVDVES